MISVNMMMMKSYNDTAINSLLYHIMVFVQLYKCILMRFQFNFILKLPIFLYSCSCSCRCVMLKVTIVLIFEDHLRLHKTFARNQMNCALYYSTTICKLSSDLFQWVPCMNIKYNWNIKNPYVSGQYSTIVDWDDRSKET